MFTLNENMLGLISQIISITGSFALISLFLMIWYTMYKNGGWKDDYRFFPNIIRAYTKITKHKNGKIGLLFYVFIFSIATTVILVILETLIDIKT